MTTYVGLLRAVNVGGRKVAMAALRQLAADLGHTRVRTYLQSGNVVFDAPPGEPGRLAGQLEARIAQELGVPTTVMLRTAADLERIAEAGHPFAGQESDLAKLHVAFLTTAPAPERSAGFTVPPGWPEAAWLDGRELYLHYPEGAGRSKLTTVWMERHLGVGATGRNWRTVLQLRDLAAG